MVDWDSFYSALREPGFVPGYEIQNHLGGGAFGEVYRLRKLSIGKSFAIKFLRLEESIEQGAGAVERELDSVRLFASIDHPNLVSIEDMGVVREVPYLIMGYAGEDTLARRIQSGELDTHSALRYFVQSCRGVLALHDRRLAHFDLKPGNIFLHGDVARVGDYGLAKLLSEDLQKHSSSRGTPQYMAPEMLRGQADLRADIYSLGVILFECFAGTAPYAEDFDELQMLRTEDQPPAFPSSFPEYLRAVVTRCLRLDPEQRYASISELLGALGQTARQGESVRLRYEELTGRTQELQEHEPLTSRGREQVESQQPEPAPEPAKRSDVVLMQTLGDAEDPSQEELEVAASLPELSSPDAAWRQELERSRSALEEGAETQPRAAGFATVPVPPASKGGLFGSVLQSLVVGIEIMAALFTGPLLAGARSLLSGTDRLLGGVPKPVGWLLRVCLMMLLMSLLGALVVGILLISLPMKPD